jgi:ABC-type multidrug transport system ATPase subunit/ABC-type multidrug transport system permease subunit
LAAKTPQTIKSLRTADNNFHKTSKRSNRQRRKTAKESKVAQARNPSWKSEPIEESASIALTSQVQHFISSAVGNEHMEQTSQQQEHALEESPAAPPSPAYEVPLIELSLRNVTYAPVTRSTSTKNKQKGSVASTKTVLDNISTSIRPFQLSAWMGPSGSGKTSCISVAAGLVPITSGSIYVNGEKGRIPKRLVGVVWQDDLLLSNLTVQENIYFAARLKTPESVDDAGVQKLVDETIREVGLWHVRHSLVGNALGIGARGVSGGERKRVSVASELVVRPSLLFLDEPTSGLDATTAQALMSTLKDLTQIGHSIAVVIHQPRTTIFTLFDSLLLLSKGNVVYNGEACKARAFLESCPEICKLPPETGIADWMMDIIAQDEKSKGRLVQHWKECQANEDCAACTHQDDGAQLARFKLSRRMSSLKELNASPKYNVRFVTQLKLLVKRTLKQQRGERLTITAALLQVAYLCFTALFWWRLPDNTNKVFERNSLLFFLLIAQANGIVINAVNVFHRERALLKRERAKKMYGVSSYFLAMTFSDLTNNVLLPLLYCCVVYWTVNFRPTFVAYIKYILAMYLTLSTAQSMGLFISIVIPSPQISLVLAPPITLLFMIMGGFYVPFQNMSPFVYWISWLSFARYGYTALIINEFEGRDVPCSADSVAIVIGESGACPLPGEDILHSLGVSGVAMNFWFNCGICLALQIFFRAASYGWLRKWK